MRVGFDGSRAFISDRTGTENYSYQLLKHLVQIDTKNSYLVYLRPNSSVNKKEWPENVKFKVLNYPRLWTQLGLSLETFKTPLDILFVPAHTLPLIRKPNLRTVMTVHDLGVEYLPSLHQLKQRLYLGFITKWQLKTATKLIAVSEATKQDLIKKVGVSSDKVAVIYEAADLTIFKTLKNDITINRLKEFDLKKDQYFFFVGTIQPRKNLSRLIESYQKFLKNNPKSKIDLVLAGTKGWLSDEIYQLPKKLGIEERIKFLGRVNDEELVSLYNGAVAFVFVSLFEGFGLPILEAFACGCPVITSNTSSMPEVAGEAAVYVEPLSAESITDGLEKILQKRATLIQLGKKQLKKFSWAQTAKETLKLLTDI